MTYTLEELRKMMNENGGDLDLRGTAITALPENLTVGGSLYLRGTARDSGSFSGPERKKASQTVGAV